MSGLNINLAGLLSAPGSPDVQLAAAFDLETARSLFQTWGGDFYFNYAANPFMKTIDLARMYVQGTTQQMQDEALAYVAAQTYVTVIGNSDDWRAEFRGKLHSKLNVLDAYCSTLDVAHGPLAAPLASALAIGRPPDGVSVNFLQGDTLHFLVTCTFPFVRSRVYQVNLNLVPRTTQAAVPASLGALQDVHVYVADFAGVGVLTVGAVEYAVESTPLEELNSDPALQFGRYGDKIVLYSVQPFTVSSSSAGLAAVGKGYLSYAVTSAVAATVPSTPLWSSGLLVNLDHTQQVAGKLAILQPAPFTVVDERNRDSSAAYAALGFERLRPYRAAPYIDLYQCVNRRFDALTPFKLSMQMAQLPNVSPLEIDVDLCGSTYHFNYAGEPSGAAAALIADPYIGITEQGLVAVIEPTTMTSPQMTFETGTFVRAVYSVVSSFPVNAYAAVSEVTFLGTQLTVTGTAEDMAAAVNQIAGFYCRVQSEPPFSFLQIQSLNAFNTGIWAAAGFPESRAGILTSPVLMEVRYQVTYNNNGGTGSQADSAEYSLNSVVTVKPVGSMVNGTNTFMGWNAAADGTGTSYAATFSISNNTILYAQWGATVTYAVNSADGSGTQEDSTLYRLGASVTVKTSGSMVNGNTTFIGWNTAAAGTGTSYAAAALFEISGNTILYAQWGAVVTYNKNDNSALGSQTDPTKYVLGSEVTVKDEGAIFNAQKFLKNWNTAANGSGTAYAVNATFLISSNTTLYAQWGLTDLTVTYNKNTASASGSQTDSYTFYNEDDTVTVLNQGSMVNGTTPFIAWNTAANGTGVSYAPNATFTISNHVTLYAQWFVRVTYSINAVNGSGSQTDTTDYELNGTVTVKSAGTMVNGNKTLIRWNTAADGSGASYEPNATFSISNNTILYAQWLPPFTVEYNINASNASGSQVDAAEYAPYTSVTVLNSGSMVNGTNTFIRWNTAADGSGASYTAGATFSISSNTTLYAQWGATVTYSAEGGVGSQSDSTVYLLGTSVSVKGIGTLVKESYAFLGWNTAADGSGAAYAQSSQFTISSNTILYAQWLSNDVLRVLYYVNSPRATGSQTDSTIYLLNDQVAVKPVGTIVNGSTTFLGWNTAADGTGISYAPDTPLTISSLTLLYAQWGATVTYATNSGGATGSQADATTYLLGASVTVKDKGSMVNGSTTFVNWNTAANGTGVSYTPNATFSISDPTVLYAQWGAVVTYNKNAASATGSQTDATKYVLGSAVTVKTQGSMLNAMKFLMGWNTAANGSGTAYAVNATFLISSNTTLYAQWGLTDLTVTYNKNAGSASGSQSDYAFYNQGATATVLNQGTMVNGTFVFIDWNTAANGSGTSYAAGATFSISNNTNLYAQWGATVTYDKNSSGATGSQSDTTKYRIGSTVTVKTKGSMARNLYLFDGWNTNALITGTSYAVGATFIISSSTILYADWTYDQQQKG